MLCASKFKLSYVGVRSSFYRAPSGLLCKTKGKFDDMIMLHLMDAYCKPLPLYGSEVYCGAKRMMQLFEERGVMYFGRFLV